MEPLVYVTSNKGKILSAIDIFNNHNIALKWFDHNCDEPNINDIEYISKHKVLEGYELIGKPCFVVDSGFYIDNYPNEPGFPGAFPKRAIINKDGLKTGIDDLLEIMKDVKDRSCQFVDCLTYYDGNEFKIFYGISKGTLAYEKRGTEQEKAKSDLWYVYIPLNHTQTLAEMTDYERDNRNDGRTSALDQFIEYLKKEEKHQYTYSKTKNNIV